MTTTSTYEAASEKDHEHGENVRLIHDDRVCSILSDLRYTRIYATWLAWLLGIAVYVTSLLAGIVAVSLVVGKHPFTLIGSVLMPVFACVVTRYHLFARFRIALTRFFRLSGTPRCPACDAALIENIDYQCSCCEHSHNSNLISHWSRECPTCDVRPEAVTCWRCDSLVKIRDVKDIRSVSVLFQPTESRS